MINMVKIDLDDIKINNNIKILITGVAGFIGSNLLEFFLKKGLYIRGIDNFSTGFQSNIDEAISEASKVNRKINFEFYKGDIRNYKNCLKATRNVDIVFHEAALGSVQRSIEEPVESSSVNINGTINLLKAALDNKVERFVYASSSSVYGDSKKLPKAENMVTNPKSIYALSKLTSENYCRLFYKLFELRTISLRYFNVFGKMQNPNSIYSAVLPLFLKNILKDCKPVIYGDGNQSRDFTYIDNVIYANYLAAFSNNYNSFGNYYNVACGKNISLNEIVDLLSEYFNRKIMPIYKEERLGDVKHSLASLNKISKDLSYKPLLNFNSGLKQLINWAWEHFS